MLRQLSADAGTGWHRNHAARLRQSAVGQFGFDLRRAAQDRLSANAGRRHRPVMTAFNFRVGLSESEPRNAADIIFINARL